MLFLTYQAPKNDDFFLIYQPQIVAALILYPSILQI